MVKFVTWFSREKGSGTRGTVNITYTAHVWVILCVCVCKREREKGRGSVCVCVCARARACVSSIPKFFFEPRILCFFLGFSESNPYTGLDRLWGFQITWQSTHEGGKGISHTHRPLPPPGNIPGTHFCFMLSRSQDHSAAWRMMSMENSNNTIVNWTLYLPVCGAVPQPTAQCLWEITPKICIALPQPLVSTTS